MQLGRADRDRADRLQVFVTQKPETSASVALACGLFQHLIEPAKPISCAPDGKGVKIVSADGELLPTTLSFTVGASELESTKRVHFTLRSMRGEEEMEVNYAVEGRKRRTNGPDATIAFRADVDGLTVVIESKMVGTALLVAPPGYNVREESFEWMAGSLRPDPRMTYGAQWLRLLSRGEQWEGAWSVKFELPPTPPEANWWLLVKCADASCTTPARSEKPEQVWFAPGLVGDELLVAHAARRVAVMLLLALLY